MLGRYFAEMKAQAEAHAALAGGREAATVRLMLGAQSQAEAAECFELLHIFTRGLFAPPAWRLPWIPYGKASGTYLKNQKAAR